MADVSNSLSSSNRHLNQYQNQNLNKSSWSNRGNPQQGAPLNNPRMPNDEYSRFVDLSLEWESKFKEQELDKSINPGEFPNPLNNNERRSNNGVVQSGHLVNNPQSNSRMSEDEFDLLVQVSLDYDERIEKQENNNQSSIRNDKAPVNTQPQLARGESSWKRHLKNALKIIFYPFWKPVDLLVNHLQTKPEGQAMRGVKVDDPSVLVRPVIQPVQVEKLRQPEPVGIVRQPLQGVGVNSSVKTDESVQVGRNEKVAPVVVHRDASRFLDNACTELERVTILKKLRSNEYSSHDIRTILSSSKFIELKELANTLLNGAIKTVEKMKRSRGTEFVFQSRNLQGVLSIIEPVARFDKDLDHKFLEHFSHD